MHLGDFLGYAAPAQVQAALQELPPLPPSAARCLLSGPERSGKTSLLFHLALALARGGQNVTLLCRRDKLEQVPPVLPEGVHIADPAWQRVAIKYISSGHELLRYASHIHVLAPPPDVLLVDDLQGLSDLPASGDRPRTRDMALCRILAALAEAADVAERLKGSPCRLVATECSHAEGPRLLYITQRWLPFVLHIRPREQGGALAVLNPKPDVPPACLATLHFSLRSGGLTLDAIHPAPPQQPQQQAPPW